MYTDLYHKVMESKNPKNRIDPGIKNTFETYKDGWNKIQDKVDKDYQKRLYQVNKEA